MRPLSLPCSPAGPQSLQAPGRATQTKMAADTGRHPMARAQTKMAPGTSSCATRWPPFEARGPPGPMNWPCRMAERRVGGGATLSTQKCETSPPPRLSKAAPQSHLPPATAPDPLCPNYDSTEEKYTVKPGIPAPTSPDPKPRNDASCVPVPASKHVER